jgi:hypothetical protein
MGMLLFYAPADCIAILFLAYSLSCYIVAGQLPMFLHALTELPGIATSHLKQYCTSDFDYRLLAVAAAFSIHFSKRVLEVSILQLESISWDDFGYGTSSFVEAICVLKTRLFTVNQKCL